MATATSGILSPNSYLLTQDAVARKLSHQEVMEQYHSSSYQQTLPSSYSHAYSSDSDTEVPYTQTSLNNSSEPQKRNKRKNFKPRCSQNVSSGEEVLNLSEFHENNNVNNNVRRRKPLTTPRKVVQDEAFSPMDLSSNTQEETGADSTERLSESDRRQSTDQMSRGSGQEYADSDSDDFTVENYRTQAENEEADENSEENESSRIPSSFSIHNLSKPHVSDPGLTFGHNLSSDQIAEMRSYAMNTMRELLGIYGLTSEVAESISRQLPLGAFNSGKIFDNLSLTPPKPTLNSSGAPLSEPPTPPSTPLSPKTPQDASKISTSFGSITITPASQYSKLSPSSTAQFSGAFGQNLHRASSPRSSYSNGISSSPNADMGEFPYLGSTRDTEGRLDFKGNHRGIFPGGAPLSYLKTESSSPPLPESSPLSAMMQQSMSTSISRDSLSSSLLLSKSTSTMDYSKYVKKYSSSVECGSTYCKDLNYREHFHCLDCNARVFLKKEEMIRHFKWHKKRDESLQHGFMRYSPLDDCGERYANCTHNKKQTHYHCIQENCDKVYISTSDVQMHSNYHRKDSAIMQEGFQRYRATEECGASYCAFFGQRTTHFHCRRSGCRFTFKNKSDMEKHKTYHIKDEQLSRDGFKKFMKNELCPFENCRFSKVCNHIHCIRPQCSYVLHSSGQLFSHKRKHERKDSELAYRKYKLAQSMMKTLADGGMPQPQLAYNALSRDYEAQIDLANFYNSQSMSNTSNVSESLSDRNSPLSFNDESEGALAMDLSENSNLPEDSYNSEDFWRKYFQVVPEGHCKESCEFHFTEHYHCITDNCQIIFSSKESTKEHARNHEQQEMITYNFFTVANDGEFCEESCVYHNKEKHYHCNIDNCKEIILSSDKPFRRLEHYKMHQYSQKLSMTKDPLTATHLTTSVEGMFGRKRGRPPKNRVIEVWNDYNTSIGSQSLMDSPQAIFTSFKLPKPSTILSISKEDDEERSSYSSKSPNQEYLQGFEHFADNTKCSDNLCHFLGRTHFHCARSRCFYATDKEETLTSHARDFHDNVKILEGFEFFDSNINCRLQICPSNGTNRHYHCTRCNYTFVQYSEMSSHNLKHMDGFREAQNFPSIRVKSEELLVKKTEMKDNEARAINLSQPSDAKHVVKAAGTFYPISTLPGHQPLSEHKNQINLPEQSSSPMTEASVSASLQLYGPETCCSRPFCKLKRKSHYHCNACNQAFSELDKLLPHVAKHSSGALHPSGSGQEDNNNSDNLGENGAQSPENLSSRPPEQKISVAPIQSLQNPQMPTESPQKEIEQPNYFTPTFDAYNHFANFPTNFASQISLMQQQNPMFHQGLYQHGLPPQLMFQHAQLLQNPLLGHQAHGFSAENLTSPLAAMAANINKRTLSDHEMTPEAKKARVQSSMRILKDEPVPVGYLRFRFNEDCKYQHCGYREHQTHFHCQRHDCGYSFCDKTRFVQHTARHERLDTLMGGDFQQYRANVSCGRQDCNYIANLGSTQNKASHFHCLKCEFVCTDTNKVVAHRRQHQKLDSIQAAGFEKFTPSQICRVSNCQHSGKQTHYHCLQCQYAVLGLAQMSAHKYRHMDN